MALHHCCVCLRGMCSLWWQPYLYSAHRVLIICHHLHSFTACDQYATTTACQQALQCCYSATVPHQAALSYHKCHLFTTQLFLFLFPHLLSLPPCSLCSVSDWMRSASVLYALWTAPGQNLTTALQHTLPQQSHEVKLSLCCAFNKFSVGLKGSWKDVRNEWYLSLMENIWRVFFFILYSRSPKVEIIFHEYTKHLPSSPETKTHKPEQRLPLSPDWNWYPCIQVKKIIKKQRQNMLFKRCQFQNFYP